MRHHSPLRLGLTLTTLVSIALVFSGCTSLFSSKSANRATLPPPADVASAPLQPLSAAQAESCVSALLEPERSQLLQQALSDGKLQAVKAQLERRGVQMNAAEAMALKLPNGEQLLIPFGATAHLVWTRANGQTAALGLVRQGHKTLNLAGDGSERVVRMLEGAKVQRLLGKLRETAKFREFEQRLREKGKRLDENKLRVLLDETGKTAIVGLVNEDSDKIVHQLRIRLKANKDDEPEQNAEPQIQPTACGQASGEAVASAATLQPQFEGGMLDEGALWGAYTPTENEYQPCVSQWGYAYACYSTSPILRMENAPVQVGAFVGQPARGRLIVYNGGGGTLTGTVTVSAPFTLVSGGSFSLRPGQPQEVVVEFTPAVEGETYSMLTVQSNMPTLPTAQVSVTGVAVRIETFYQLLSGLSQATELSAVIPGGYVQPEMGLLGFKDLSPTQIEALRLLSQNKDFGSLKLVPPWLPAWIASEIASYFLGKALELLTTPPPWFSMDTVTQTLNDLKTSGNLYHTDFDRYYDARPSFKAFVDNLMQMSARTLQIYAYPPDSLDLKRAVAEMLRHVSEMYRTYNQEDMDRMLGYFGPAAAFGFAGLSRLGNSETLSQVFNDLRKIMVSQDGASWYGQKESLWNSIVASLVVLGAGVLGVNSTTDEAKAIWKAFRETTATFAVVGKMAEGPTWRNGGWQIHIIRAVSMRYSGSGGDALIVDVVATRKSMLADGKDVAILGQFFHAVTGFDPGSIDRLTKAIREIAEDKLKLLAALGGALGITNRDSWGSILSSKPGAVVAVDPANTQSAVQVLKNGLRTELGRDYCGGKCFAIVVEVNRDGMVTKIIGLGITDAEAASIAARMGFIVGRLAPWVTEGVRSVDILSDKKSLATLTPTPRDPRSCNACD